MESKQAGVQRFDKFGVMNLIDALAGGDVLKYDSVMYIEYNTIYIKLLMNKEQMLFNRRLQANAEAEMRSKQKRYR
jgi:hypothetical protein